jgi:heme-degrading monooxygenase HmoA
MIHQLRIYQIEPTLKDAFDKRFKEHAWRIMKSYGFKVVAMWYSAFDGKTEFVYILQWPDEQTIQKQWAAFMADAEWEAIKRTSRGKYGEMVLGKVRDQALTSVNWFSDSSI